MPYELGGRSDKSGNRFETRVVVYHLLKLLEEKIEYVVLEALGNDESGIDLWIGHNNGTREGMQCKGRNGSKEYWDFGTANAKNIFINWKQHLERDPSIHVSLASPLAFTFLEDLIDRAIKSSDIPSDFYENQVIPSSKEFVSFFRNICRVMKINPELEHDLVRFTDYLGRIRYRQFPDNELKELIFYKMEYLFSGDVQKVYNSIVSWIIDGEMLGKSISLTDLYKFLGDNNIELKNLALDKRIIPRILEINREYHEAFQPLNSGLFLREEFKSCREAVSLGKSLIIHGQAGRGKSGCTEDIINYCKEEGIQYIAVKLDKRIPSGTAEKWGADLGLPTSIVHCIHSVTKNEKAVIILDQLDALRWTQAHSHDALLVCSQIIEQVVRLNAERKQNISLVYVCRTYDLENDNSIKAIFKSNNRSIEDFEFEKVHIDELQEEKVQDIVGKRYIALTNKLKDLLRSPSNLYIWQHLEQGNEYNECSTTNHLVNQWWQQLSNKYFNLGYDVSELNETKGKLVNQLDKLGRMYIPVNSVLFNNSILEYLSSNGFLVLQDNKVSFSHQSLLDCLIAEKMLQQYYSGENIVDIVGSKEKQNAGRRYQLQMLMQNLIEYDSQDFIDVGLQILNSGSIRFSNKFVFFEILNQLDEVNSFVSNFIIENCESKPWSNHIISNVIYSRIQFYRVLRDAGVLERWFTNSEKKEIAFNLLASIQPNYDSKDVDFIKRHAFKSQNDDNRFAQCFYRDIYEDSDEMFELRMQFYREYPMLAANYIDFKSMLKKCELRTIRYFAFLLENKIKDREQIIHKYENEFVHEEDEFLIQKGEEVLKLLLPHLPMNDEKIHAFSEWSGKYYKGSIERACVNIIKKANAAIISSNPDLIWDYYGNFVGKDNYIYNELLLDVFFKLPITYSDYIISLLCDDFQNIIFDKTSGNGNELNLVKCVIKKHGAYCNQEIFNKLENNIFRYVSPNASDVYKQRIEINKQCNNNKVYWSFWGDLQYELLNVLPNYRLSKDASNLLQVLRRKFVKDSTLYKYSSGHSGTVYSPIYGKKLSNRNWLGIILNGKLKDKKESHWREVPGGFIENSIEEFARSFNSVVSENPEEMLRLVLSQEKNIDDSFIDALFSGIAYSNLLIGIDKELIEKVILRYKCKHDSYRASYICTIMEKKKHTAWSKEIIDVLLDIAINYRDPEDNNRDVTNSDNKEMYSFDTLFSNAINCVRGKAAEALGTLLWDNPEHFCYFQDTIEVLINDENPAVRLSSLFVLWPVYNINNKWASEKILKLIEDDYRMAGFYDMKNMLYLLYSDYPRRVLKIIEKCYESDDTHLEKMGARCVSEMYILEGEFDNKMNEVSSMSNKQAEEILLMVMLYFNKDEYNELSKKIICRFKNSELDLEMPISRLFFDDLIDLERDRKFLLKIVDSKLSRNTFYAFVHYLEEESRSFIAYKDIILSMSHNMITRTINSEEKLWGIDDSISKLVIGLYDEVSGSIQPIHKAIANECLDLWDLMFEKQIGSARSLSQEMMKR